MSPSRIHSDSAAPTAAWFSGKPDSAFLSRRAMILVNGAATDHVAVTDRGLAYGDGVFRTLVARRGAPFAWPWHFRKLERDCASLAIPCPAERDLMSELERVLDGSKDEVVK